MRVYARWPAFIRPSSVRMRNVTEKSIYVVGDAQRPAKLHSRSFVMECPKCKCGKENCDIAEDNIKQ